MFDKHRQTKVVEMFISYTDPIEPFVHITEWQSDCTPSPSQPKNTKPMQRQPKNTKPMQQQPSNSTLTYGDSYLKNPLPENEHVGVDEEAMYLTNEPAGAENALICVDEEQQHEKYPADDGSDSAKFEEEVEEIDDSEDEDVVEPENIPNAQYDVDDPPMPVGSTYPNMEEFKLALSCHAIRKEFEFDTEKSTPYRLRAYCSRKSKDNCPWRIHASTMETAKLAATAYLRKSHTRLWTRSQFSTRCKVDYVTNNLAECFNNWIKPHKSLNLDELMDKIRQMLMRKWNQRRKISMNLEGLVLVDGENPST
jgi:hypothetical protein